MTQFLLHPYFLGIVGALAPEIVRLYKWRRRKNAGYFGARYFIVSVLYALLGGLLAYLVADPTKAVSALYTGAALPFVLDAGVKTVIPEEPSSGTEEIGVEETDVVRIPWTAQLRSFAMTLGA